MFPISELVTLPKDSRQYFYSIVPDFLYLLYVKHSCYVLLIVILREANGNIKEHTGIYWIKMEQTGTY